MTKDQSSVFRGLNHVAQAKEYFLDVARSQRHDAKMFFTRYAERMDWVLKDIKHRLDPPAQAAFERELEKGDTLWTESIIEQMADLNQQEGVAVEMFILHLKKTTNAGPDKL